MREVWILRRLRHKGDVEITNEIIGLFWELSDAMEEVGGDEIVKWEEVGESYVYGTYKTVIKELETILKQIENEK
jgi:hypothetical protein